jgi:hypothetical protein
MHDAFKKTFKNRVAEEAKKVVKKMFRDEVVAAKCRKSILMHNADKGHSLAEQVIAAEQ